jgi:hypothetical protein
MTDEPLSDIERARAEFAATLGQIEAKLNLPKRARASAKRAGDRFEKLKEENPIALTGIIVGAVVAVGGGAWLATRMLKNSR